MSPAIDNKPVKLMSASQELDALFSLGEDPVAEKGNAKMEATMWSVELFRHEVKALASESPDVTGLGKAKSFVDALKSEYGVEPDVLPVDIRVMIINETLEGLAKDNARLRVRSKTMDIVKDTEAKAMVTGQIEFIVGAAVKLIDMRNEIANE